jgi:hypothetical protein
MYILDTNFLKIFPKKIKNKWGMLWLIKDNYQMESNNQ